MGVIILFDSVIIGKLDSSYDFDASMSEREISEPKKKSIKETVPFSNAVYDFTKINGEIYWEERQLTYVFEIIADSPEELEDKKRAFKQWVMNVHEEELHDPYIKDYHFIATFSEISCDDSEVEKSTITVVFTAYPYMISDAKKKYSFALTEELRERKVVNNSGHRIVPTFISNTGFTLQIGDESYVFASGETTYEPIKLESGDNLLYFQTASGSGTVRVEFYEEVF